MGLNKTVKINFIYLFFNVAFKIFSICIWHTLHFYWGALLQTALEESSLQEAPIQTGEEGLANYDP